LAEYYIAELKGSSSYTMTVLNNRAVMLANQSAFRLDAEAKLAQGIVIRLVV